MNLLRKRKQSPPRTKPYTRKAHHAGSWYPNNSHALTENISNVMTAAENERMLQSTTTTTKEEKERDDDTGIPRGIIAPHAGFSYSGSTAAYAYLALKEVLSSSSCTVSCTVLVLHPSHHVYLKGCAISGASTIETPIKPIAIDNDLRSELQNTGSFSIMDQDTDEAEHSGEMQYPFISKCFTDRMNNYSNLSSSPSTTTTTPPPPLLRLLPIMVGALSTTQEVEFGKLLAPFLARPNIFVVISTDFCHWGERFRYSPTPTTAAVELPPLTGTTIPSSSSSSSDTPEGAGQQQQQQQQHEQIYEYIERLDRIGMNHISMQQPGAFATYMKDYKNTICGRAPIAVYLNAIDANKQKGVEQLNLKFVKYAQSGQVRSRQDSSVSYASAIARKLVN